MFGGTMLGIRGQSSLTAMVATSPIATMATHNVA